MDLENGDKVPATPTNSPPPELEYPWDKEEEDELECVPCEAMEDEEEGQLVKTKPLPKLPSKEDVELHNKLTYLIDLGVPIASGVGERMTLIANWPNDKGTYPY